jgi:hypothetical protein
MNGTRRLHTTLPHVLLQIVFRAEKTVVRHETALGELHV